MDSPVADILIGQISSVWSKDRGIPTVYFPETDSTNQQAKLKAFDDKSFSEDLILYIADSQTQGRGRFDRTWSSTGTGKSFLSSWSFLARTAPNPVFTAKCGLALYNAAKNTWGFLPWKLKAPNDLYIENKKVAGILVETTQQGDDVRLIIGLGFNVLNSPHKMESATSLIANLENGTPLLGEDWISFLERFLAELTLIIPQCEEELTSTEKANLIYLYNLHSLNKIKIETDNDFIRALNNHD